MIAVAEALRRIAIMLSESGVEHPRREARLLLAHALGWDATNLLAVGEVHENAGLCLARRRARHEPLAYIIGRREFWSLPFAVSPAVLIPRPDSETLIEAALTAKSERALVQRILDLGTGSGCLLLAAISEYRGAFGIGVDISLPAVQLARRNALSLGLAERTSFAAGVWTDAIASRFDLVLSNPPYIPHDQISALMPEVGTHEPHLALDGGVDGLDAYRNLLGRLSTVLEQGGAAIFELGQGQAAAVAALASKAGFAAETQADLAGIPRAMILRRD